MESAAYEKERMVEFKYLETLAWVLATVGTVVLVAKIVAVEVHDLVQFVRKLWQNLKDDK